MLDGDEKSVRLPAGPAASRRRWSEAEKRRIVAESYHPGVSVSVERERVVAFHTRLSGVPYAANRAVAVLSRMYGMAASWGMVPDGTNLSLPFIPSIAETLEFCITTGYPFRHA